jgi:hypothetical protein
MKPVSRVAASIYYSTKREDSSEVFVCAPSFLSTANAAGVISALRPMSVSTAPGQIGKATASMDRIRFDRMRLQTNART